MKSWGVAAQALSVTRDRRDTPRYISRKCVSGDNHGHGDDRWRSEVHVHLADVRRWRRRNGAHDERAARIDTETDGMLGKRAPQYDGLHIMME